MCAGKSKELLSQDTGILLAVEVQAKPSFRERQGTAIKIKHGPKRGMIHLEIGTELFTKKRGYNILCKSVVNFKATISI
jgi:hypothetical protein